MTITSDTLTIGASDTALEVAASPGTVHESGSAHTIRVTAGFAGATSSALSAGTAVTVAVAAGDTDGATVAASCSQSMTEDVCTDQTGNSFTVTIPAGQTSHTGTFHLTARDDNAAEGVEKVKISGSATVAGESESDSDTINVVDSGITLSLTNASNNNAVSALSESSASTTIRVTATLPAGTTVPSGGVVVGLNIAGTATADSDNVWTEEEDYRISLPPKPASTPDGYATGVTIAQGETSGAADITITVNDDNVDEPDKTITVNGSTVTISSVVYHTVAAALTISDNDDPPANIDLALHRDDEGDIGAALTQVPEGGEDVVWVRASFQGTVTRSAATSVPIVVGKAAGESTPGTDYQTVSAFNVVIDPYQTSGTGTFTLKTDGTYDDENLEGNETLTVAGGTLAGFTIGQDTLTIIDDETITLTLTPDEVNEGDAVAAATLRAAYPGAALTTSQTINLALGGDAVAGTDYTAPTLTTLEIPANQNSATLPTFALQTTEDNIAEGDEILQITGTVAGYAVTPAAFTIKDDDNPPTSIQNQPLRKQLGRNYQRYRYHRHPLTRRVRHAPHRHRRRFHPQRKRHPQLRLSNKQPDRRHPRRANPSPQPHHNHHQRQHPRTS